MQHAQNNSFETFDASEYKVAIAVSRFNSDITEQLCDNARQMLKKYSVPDTNITVVRVAGAIELPLALQALAKTKQYNCLVALGAVIRGATTHYEYVCGMAADGVMRVQLDTGLPIGFGVLTCENIKQALERIDVGGSATEAALQSANLIKQTQS